MIYVKHLVNAFYLNYINSINNKNDSNNIIEVKKIIKENLKKSCKFDTGDKDIYLKYSEIFKILRNIQKVTKKILTEYNFNFIGFLRLLKKVEINDLYLIEFYIDETLKMLDEFCGKSGRTKIQYFYYYNLVIVKNLIQNVLDYIDKNRKYDLSDFTLNDEDELKSKSILVKEFLKIDLVIRLEL